MKRRELIKALTAVPLAPLALPDKSEALEFIVGDTYDIDGQRWVCILKTMDVMDTGAKVKQMKFMDINGYLMATYQQGTQEE